MKEPAPDEGIYDFAPEPPRAVMVIPVAATEYETPKALEYHTPQNKPPGEKFDTETLKNFQIPLALLVGGIVVDVIFGAVWSGHPLQSTLAVLADAIFGTAFMLVGIFIAAKFRHLELGDLRTSILKLAAICVAPAAVAAFVSPIARFIPLGFLLAWVIQFVLYFALLGALFDLDESDTWYCVWVILLVRLAVYGVLVAIGQFI